MEMNVEPEQTCECVPEGAEPPMDSKASPNYGLIGHVTNLLGKTVGLTQTAGVKTAGGIFSASRRVGRKAGRLIRAPFKLGSWVSSGQKKRHELELQLEVERLRDRIERLHVKIGERVCHSPVLDRSILTTDPRLEALVSTALNYELKVENLRQRVLTVPEGPPPPEDAGSPSAGAPAEPGPGWEAQAGEPSPPAAPREDEASPSDVE